MKDSLPILLVEDDNIDVIMFNRALGDLNITNRLIHFADCREALEYLENEDNQKPWFVLADLNTPQMNGLEFLRAIKAHDALKQIIVVILSGSDDEEDIAESFRLGVAGYIVKPPDYEKLVEMIRTIHTYWSLSELPRESVISQSR
ncbi:MAG: response regulator [Phycisphaerae bacterium]|nr:response regulator [Phycisphaerae bacterium]